jgi:glycosyltransferase involved in cell wall biosynthesis
MKVLYALWNYPQYSETYIAAEISYALRSGIQVEVWSPTCRHPQMKPLCKVHRGSLQAAALAMKPDIIHVHYLTWALKNINEFPDRTPVTVRGHSFDWNKGDLEAVTKIKKVKKIFLFPHFAAQVKGEKKVVSLPVAYDSTIHKPSPDKNTKLVTRLAAGLPTKGLQDLFSIAKACPHHEFSLVVSSAGGAEGFVEALSASKERPSNLIVLADISEHAAVSLNGKAGIYLDTYDPAGHAFGMPISIAEAMATGSLVLVQWQPDASDYLGNGGLLYKNPEEAARIIQESTTYQKEAWANIASAAIERARTFQDVAVLPKLIQEWKTLL